jgi:hypothetical protein
VAAEEVHLGAVVRVVPDERDHGPPFSRRRESPPCLTACSGVWLSGRVCRWRVG